MNDNYHPDTVKSIEQITAETECHGCEWLNICSQNTKCLSCRDQFNRKRRRSGNKRCAIPESLINFYCKHPAFMTEHAYRGRFLASFGKNRELIDYWPESPDFCPIDRKKETTPKGDAS